MRRTLLSSAFAATLSMLAPAAGATTWLCGLSEDSVRIVCIADETSAQPAEPLAAIVNGTRFPLDSGRRWTVDLWSPPTDLELVETLAKATICYRSPRCEVVFTAPRAWATRKPA